MGDNRNASADSRYHLNDNQGTVPENVVGQVVLTVWPFSAFHPIPFPPIPFDDPRLDEPEAVGTLKTHRHSSGLAHMVLLWWVPRRFPIPQGRGSLCLRQRRAPPASVGRRTRQGRQSACAGPLYAAAVVLAPLHPYPTNWRTPNS